MSNSKISALSSATTPLAGTETLPVVQSSTTKQVSVANLTAGRAVDVSTLNASSTITAGSSIRSTTASGGQPEFVLTQTSIASWTMYNPPSTTDLRLYNGVDRYTFGSTGDLTLKTGNLIPGTAAKGINFTANTPAAGMTSQLLNWYEEGTFTPTYSSTGTAPTFTYARQDGKYTRIGRQIFYTIEIQTNSISGGTGSALISGLPFTSKNARYTGFASVSYASGFLASTPLSGYIANNSTSIGLTYQNLATSISEFPISQFTNAASANYLIVSGSYLV